MVDACGYAEWQGVRFWAITSGPLMRKGIQSGNHRVGPYSLYIFTMSWQKCLTLEGIKGGPPEGEVCMQSGSGPSS